MDVIGTSKGRGFAGVVRRHHFGGGPKSHGHMFQVQGSIGASSFPSRVFPGQRMPGHYGAEQVTVRNLRIRGIDLEENLLMVEGAVPGSREGYVLISKAKTPPRERRGFAGSGYGRSVEGFEEGRRQAQIRPPAVGPTRLAAQEDSDWRSSEPEKMQGWERPGGRRRRWQKLM